MNDDLAQAIYNTFKTEDGKTVLAWIMDQAGYFNPDASTIKPELIALINRLLLTGHMTITGDMGRYTTAVIESYENSSFEGWRKL